MRARSFASGADVTAALSRFERALEDVRLAWSPGGLWGPGADAVPPAIVVGWCGDVFEKCAMLTCDAVLHMATVQDILAILKDERQHVRELAA